MFHLHLFATAISMLTALLNLLTVCLHTYDSFAAKDFILLIFILSIFLMHVLTSFFTLSSLTLVNSGTFFLFLFFHLTITLTLLKECQDTSNVNWTSSPCFFSPIVCFTGSCGTRGIFYVFFFLSQCNFNVKRNMTVYCLLTDSTTFSNFSLA